MAALAFESISSLNEYARFQSKTELYEFVIMHIIGENRGPIGSWEMKIVLNDYEAELSTASIGRYLKELDSKGMTEAVSNKGRVLTEKGRAVLAEKEENIRTAMLHNNIREAVEITQGSQLVQLYSVREALEIEAVREAVKCASDEELGQLSATIDAYYECIEKDENFTDPALQFHVVLAEISQNRFLEAILKMLIYEQKRIEAKFEILVTREMEQGRTYAREHEKILQALLERNEKKASELMAVHLKGTRETLEAGTAEVCGQSGYEPAKIRAK